MRWVPLVAVASGIGLGLACGGPSAPAATPASPGNETPKTDEPALPPYFEAGCAACPSALTTALAGCEIEQATIQPSELSARDGCVLRLRCGNTAVQTHCDGENDGTNTSLCECERNGVRDAHVLKDLYPGEGPEACLAAAVDCKTPRPESPKLAD
jgi:hypothetical protein